MLLQENKRYVCKNEKITTVLKRCYNSHMLKGSIGYLNLEWNNHGILMSTNDPSIDADQYEIVREADPDEIKVAHKNETQDSPTVDITKIGVKDHEVLASGGKKFETGAVRSGDKETVAYHLISPIGLRRIAETYKEGQNKYGSFNWERGMPIGDLCNHAIAHIYAYLNGEQTGEDDLAHAAWNLIAAMHMEEKFPNLNHDVRPVLANRIASEEKQT